MIQEDYVCYDVARLLCAKKFPQHKTAKAYDSYGEFIWSDVLDPYECSAPTLQMAMKWLRTEKNIYIEIRRSFDTFLYGAIILKQDGIGIAEIGKTYFYYEDAVNAALSYALKNFI